MEFRSAYLNCVIEHSNTYECSKTASSSFREY
uniref:Uncharacterized protein n=1 Tax=Nelumbo nucifera TaxID=4432 RepID=A0A822XE99_NELNU|nr:TPA_asm: hypothetical protein HUJ06_019446 [Nelumbo nucifera]